MSYTINDKVYTEHPIMDEIVYNCKVILSSIVVKNDIYANSFETQESVNNAEYYSLIKEGKMQFAYCPFTYQSLKAYGYSSDEILKYLNDKNEIPVEDRDELVEFCSNYFIENFEEINDYYRSFMGLPPYNTTKFDVYITEDNFPPNYDTSLVDFSLPIHKQPINIISLLESTGELEKIRSDYPDSFSYSYLRYLGYKSLNDYEMRKADKWEIMYMPSCERMVRDKFIQFFIYNRNIYLRRYYQEAYSINNQHYENIMIINLLSQTFADMIVDVPEWYIRRDIFDIRSVQYFLESFGVAYYKEIPLKYQIRIVKNLNKLIKYKSSNRNNQDILDIFNATEASIYKYFLYKKRLIDPITGKYVVSENPEDEYDLKFVKVKLGDNYDDYIRKDSYIFDYDTLTLLDKWWDGKDSHDYVKQEHLDRDFTIEGTKYMGLEYTISMEDYLFQLMYFLGLLIDSRTNTNFEDMRIAVPSLQESTTFNLSDLFLLLILLSYSFDNMDDMVRKPEDCEEPKVDPEPEFEFYDMYDGGYANTRDYEFDIMVNGKDSGSPSRPKQSYSDLALSVDGGSSVFYSEIKSKEIFIDWMKPKFPELFVKNNHMEYGYNPEVDLNQISKIIGRKHSSFNYTKGYTLEDFGVENYIVPTEIKDITQLIYIYKNNKVCHDNLIDKMKNAQNNDEYRIMEFVYNSLFTKKFDYELYKINGYDITNLSELLKNRDYILYNIYESFNSEKNIETRKDNIRAIIADIVGTLEYYINDDGLNYIFSFISGYAFQDLIRYIYLMISFFKSYKVYFLDPQVTYITESSIGNSAGDRPRDAIRNIKESIGYYDKLNNTDAAIITEIVLLTESALSKIVKEVLDIYSHFDPDPKDDYDYDGMYASTNLEYKEADGGYADPNSCIPYIMLNAGPAQGSRLDIWDLNGDGPEERINTLDVNGGYSLDLSSYRKDYFGTMFTYIINAGSASTNTFMTRSAITRVVDRAISTDIRVSKAQYNSIEIKEDGLYLKDIYTDWTDFNELVDEQKDFMRDMSAKYNDLNSTIELIDDSEEIDNIIRYNRDILLNPMYKILSYDPNLNDVKQELRDYTDKTIEDLWNEFYAMDPMSSWGTLYD